MKDVDYDNKTVSLMVEPTTDPKALITALEKAGYGGSVKQ